MPARLGSHPVTVIILTYNEQLHIDRAIRQLANFPCEVVVVDSGSTDDTVRIAADLGANVFYNKFITQSSQMNWALKNIPLATDWVMRLDADEIVGRDLQENLMTLMGSSLPSVHGMYFDRRHIFLGRWIRHGGRYPVRLLRVWRNGSAESEERLMDEHMVLKYGETVLVKGLFADHNVSSLHAFTVKHSNYATRQAIADISGDILTSQTARNAKLEPSAVVKRKLGSILMGSFPLGVGPLIYLAYRLVIRAGFLDGPEGIIYHVLQGGWYRFLVEAKRNEIVAAIAGMDAKQSQAKLTELLTRPDAAFVGRRDAN